MPTCISNTMCESFEISSVCSAPHCMYFSNLFVVFMEAGKKHSQILQEQRQNGGLLGGGLRYPMDQLVIFWVQCEQKILDERCDKRVDKMIAEGLLGEMQDFHEV